MAFSPDGALLASAGDRTIRIWNPRNGKQVDGTGFGQSRTRGRPLAGVSSDSPASADLIGVEADVETLAGLIAASDTRPPLAIALIGDWGAGKSSVMLQVQERIELLAEMSHNNPGLSSFAATVRQVRFNAWHYSDDYLWTGLITHLFQVLASPETDPQAGDTPGQPDARKIRAERAELASELAARRGNERRLTEALRSLERIARPRGSLAWLSSPGYAAGILALSIRETARDLRESLAIVVSWLILAAGAYEIWDHYGHQIGTAATAVALIAAPVMAGALKLRLAHRTGMRLARRQRRALEDRQRHLQSDIASLEGRLTLIDAAARLTSFLNDRNQSAGYQEYRGLLGQVHADLLTLSGDLAAARAQWLAAGSVTPPPLERIVVYIDDLDRCPPRRVVQVLEAVHLMLALDLFVVVVAVDARWLIRSLEYHHRELFASQRNDSPGAEPPDLASPVDYLDKIFQVPYALLPLEPGAAATYLRALLPEPASTAIPAPADSTAAGSETGLRDPPDLVTPLTAEAGTPGTTASPLHDHPSNQHDDASPGYLAGDPLGQLHSFPPRQAESSIPDLRPQGLQLTRAEIEFMASLGALLPTPRAAKRMVNLYRLVRISIPETELPAFTAPVPGSPYQVTQILLALLTGHPAAAAAIFSKLITAPQPADILTMLSDLDSEHGSTTTELRTIIKQTALPTDVSHYKTWCLALARYSFHTRNLATPPDPPSTRERNLTTQGTNPPSDHRLNRR